MKPRGYPAKVTWWDSNSFKSGTWINYDDVTTLNRAMCISYGEVLFEDEHEIRIVSHICAGAEKDEEHDYQGAICIPLACIDKLERISFPEIPPATIPGGALAQAAEEG